MSKTIEFIHQCCFESLPDPVIKQTLQCLLDLVGVAAGGTVTPASQIMRDHAASQFLSTSKGARMLFDGRRVSVTGAALAGAITIDSLDAHDGHPLAKGHAGAAVLPALLAFVDSGYSLSGKEFIATLAMSYEIACRAGIALHESACDYHTSGAWNTIACAATGARILGMNEQKTREAMGIAEYYGPRSQMMRCIDHPTMVKDGSGWGAMTGVSAACLANAGYTGAPAITVEYDDVQPFWEDIGERWQILEQYIKAYPVCRWAQPAVEAALSLQKQHGIDHSEIAYVEVFTFHEGIRLAATTPDDTDQAQYSLPFPVATALVAGKLTAEEVTGAALSNRDVLRLSQSMVLKELAVYNDQFPKTRKAHIKFYLHDGRVLESETMEARGNYDNPFNSSDLRDKFHAFSHPVVGNIQAQSIEKAIDGLASGGNSNELCDLILVRV